MAGRSYNKVMLVGNCAKEPEVRQQGAYRTATVNVATNEYRPDGKGGFSQTTEWHRVKFWNNLADRAASQLRKGSRIFVEGRLSVNSYPDKNYPDVIQRSYEVNADSYIILDRRSDNGDDYNQDGQYNGGYAGNNGYQGYNAGNNNYNGFAAPPSNFSSQGSQQNQGYGNFGNNNFNNNFSQGGYNQGNFNQGFNQNNRNSGGMGGAGNGGEDVPF